MKGRTMEMTEKHLDKLSSVRCRYFTCDFPTGRAGTILVVKFSGQCGFGSQSNGDCLFMEAMVQAGLAAFDASALVLDLSELGYEWGDMMTDVLCAGEGHLADAAFPTAVVVSDKNRAGLTSLVEREMQSNAVGWLFDTIENACLSVGEQWQELMRSATPPIA
jgi:hypothetical protein